MFPVYKGTFERSDEEEPPVSSGHQYAEWVIKWVKDFKRSVDYLETRPDIDNSKLEYSNSICPDEFDCGQMECTLTNLNLNYPLLCR